MGGSSSGSEVEVRCKYKIYIVKKPHKRILGEQLSFHEIIKMNCQKSLDKYMIGSLKMVIHRSIIRYSKSGGNNSMEAPTTMPKGEKPKLEPDQS